MECIKSAWYTGCHLGTQMRLSNGLEGTSWNATMESPALWGAKPLCQYRVGPNLMGSSSTDKDPAEPRFTLWPCGNEGKARTSCISRSLAAGWVKWLFLSTQDLWRNIWNSVSYFGPLSEVRKMFYNDGGWAPAKVAHRNCGISIPGDTQSITGHDSEQPDLTSKPALLWAVGWTTRLLEIPSSLNFSIILWFMISLSKSCSITLLKKMICTSVRGKFQAVLVFPIETLATAYVNIFKMFFNIVTFFIFQSFRRKTNY